MSDTTATTPANFRLIYPNLFIALALDYSHSKDWGYIYAIMLGDTNSMRLFRGTGKTKEEAINEALRSYENEFHSKH